MPPAKPAVWVLAATAHDDCASCDALVTPAIADALERGEASSTYADTPPDAETRHFATVVGGRRIAVSPHDRPRG